MQRPASSTSLRRADAPAVAATPRDRLSLLRAVAGGYFLFRGILTRGLFDHLSHHLAVTRHERRDLLEAGPVPALELHHARTFVVGTARLDRWKEPGAAQFLDAVFGQVQMLEPPAQLLWRHHLALAVVGLRDTQCLDHDHAVGNTAVVHDVTEPVRILEVALLGAVDLGLDVLYYREIGARCRKRGAHVSLGGIRGRHHVFLRRGPPHA